MEFINTKSIETQCGRETEHDATDITEQRAVRLQCLGLDLDFLWLYSMIGTAEEVIQ